MAAHRLGHRALLALLVVAILATAIGGAQKPVEAARCESYSMVAVPKFRTARKYRTDVRPGLELYISISPKTYNHDALIALVCSVAQRHSQEQSLFLRVFNSYSGAKRYNPLGEGNDENAVKSFLAFYAFARDKGVQTLEWRPDPANTEHWESVDLGSLPKRDTSPSAAPK